MQQLRSAGAARDVLLSVATRRALEQGGAPPPGNWVFFYDQLRNLLGRAIQFWLPEGHGLADAALPRALYQLTEAPSAQDTVALDDFGRVAWSWQGPGDQWRHELEWLVEAVPRYAPIQGQRAGLGPDTKSVAMEVRRTEPGKWHRLVLPRRASFTARFGLTQVLNAGDDAFVIALDAPHEFRQSLYNSVARTRQGVLRMHPARARTTFLFADKYDGADPALLEAWLGGQKGSATERPPRMEFALPGAATVGSYGELVYDEPPCMALETSVGASADDEFSAEPAEIGPLQRRRTHTLDAPPPLTVTKQLNNMQIVVPLARLDWFYTGDSRPSIGPYISSAALQAFAELSLLRLPDPEAELLLYFQFANQPLTQVVHFRGIAFKGKEWNMPGEPLPVDLGWGEVRTWLGLQVSWLNGDLQIDMDGAPSLPQQVVARWRCAGLTVSLLPWKE